jgi:hypothetical protein
MFDVSIDYHLVPVPCGHCRATLMRDETRHQPQCPADSGNLVFFGHPDLMDLDAHLGAFYPEP